MIELNLIPLDGYEPEDDSWDYPEDQEFIEEIYIREHNIPKDIIEFKKTKTKYQYMEPTFTTVAIYINGKNLLDKVMAEGLGEHAELTPSRLYHEITNDKEFLYGAILSLYCCGICGEEGCWPVHCRIRENQNSVVWSAFENDQKEHCDPKHPMTYVFDKQQYHNELEKLKSWF